MRFYFRKINKETFCQTLCSFPAKGMERVLFQDENRFLYTNGLSQIINNTATSCLQNDWMLFSLYDMSYKFVNDMIEMMVD